jgi:hypothetical protein
LRTASCLPVQTRARGFPCSTVALLSWVWWYFFRSQAAWPRLHLLTALRRTPSQYAAFAGPAIDVDASELGNIGQTDPLGRLARGEIPVIILRRTLSVADCQKVLQQCYDVNQFPASFVLFIPSLHTGMADMVETPAAGQRAAQHGVYDVAEIQEAGDIAFASMENASMEAQPLATRSDIGYSLAGGGITHSGDVLFDSGIDL